MILEMLDLRLEFVCFCCLFSSFVFYRSVSGLDPLGRFSRLPHIGPLLHGALQGLGLLLVDLHIVHLLIRGHRGCRGFSVRAGWPRLEVQRQVVHVAAFPRGRAAGATHGWGGRRWVHSHIILLAVCRVGAGDALCGDRTTMLGGHGVHSSHGPCPGHGDWALKWQLINDPIVLQIKRCWLRFSVRFEVAVDGWRCDITETAGPVTQGCAAPLTGR